MEKSTHRRNSNSSETGCPTINQGEQVLLKNVITFTTVPMALWVIGLLFLPSSMLTMVGIVGDDEVNFSFTNNRSSCSCSCARRTGFARFGDCTAFPRGIDWTRSYLFLSSLVDFYRYMRSIVNEEYLLMRALREVKFFG